MSRKSVSFSNDFVHVFNQLTGKNSGSAPSYSSLANAILNKGAVYPGQSNPNGYVPTSVLRDIPSAPSSTTRPKPTGSVSAPSFFSFLSSLLSRTSPSRRFSGSSGSLSSGSSDIPSTVPNYLNADLARHYGMDATTAYQEALANTAHQREVKDLQAAGLNPILSTRYGGASGVSGASVYAPLPEASSSSGAVNAKEASILANLASGVVGLVTGSSAKSNAAKDIINSLGSIVSSLSPSRE